MSRRPCITCGRPCAGAYCLQHFQDAEREGEWRRETRPLVLKRDAHRCRYQLTDCTGTATTVHRLAEYGKRHDGNLAAYVSACAHCHGVVDGGRAKGHTPHIRPQPAPA